MALKIRLTRRGAKKRPFYRIVVADSRKPRDGRYIERLGHYDPMLGKEDPKRVLLNEERIKYWLGEGAQTSKRVAHFLAAVDMGEKPVITEQTKQHLPRTKTLERMKEAEEAAKAKAAAAEAAEAAAAEAPAEEAPATEAAAEETPAEEAPAEEAPAEAAAAEEAPAEEAAAEEAPAEEAAAEEKKAE